MTQHFAGPLGELPPQLRGMIPAKSRPRTPEESLSMLVGIIEMLARRGADAANGLKIVQTPDERGVTIRIDLPG